MKNTHTNLLEKAMKEGYAVPAFNFPNLEILLAIIETIKETKSPAILQISESAIKYFTPCIIKGIISSIHEQKLPVSIHLDHGHSYESIKLAINLGFDSVMIDGSLLSFKENVKLTKKCANLAHKKGVHIEAEIGALKGDDDNPNASDVDRFTNPLEAKKFVELTNVDSLAIAIGTNHGAYKFKGNGKIRKDILKKIEKYIPHIPLVLHGASLIEPEIVTELNSLGGKINNAKGNDGLLNGIYKTHICKINMDSDLRLAYTLGIRKSLHENPENFDPRVYGKIGLQQVKETAKSRIIKICHSNNKVN